MECLELEKNKKDSVKFEQNRIKIENLERAVSNLSRRIKGNLEIHRESGSFLVTLNDRQTKITDHGTLKEVYNQVLDALSLIDKINAKEIKLK